jgi:hypothetical protein
MCGIDHDERWQRSDREVTSDCRVPVDIDATELKGVVVRSSLEHLREVALGTTRWPRAGAVKEQ